MAKRCFPLGPQSQMNFVALVWLPFVLEIAASIASTGDQIIPLPAAPVGPVGPVAPVDPVAPVAPAAPAAVETKDLPEDIQLLIEKRDLARASKEYKVSDELRTELEGRGYRVDDSPSGTIVTPTS